MRSDVFIFAGGAVLTAIGLRLSPDSAFWDLVICAGVIAMTYSAADGVLRLFKIGQFARLLTYGFLGAVLVGGIAFVYVPLYRELPGFSSFLFVRLYDTPEARRKYIFDFESPTNSGASAYLSSSDIFTFSVTDTHGETYNLEVPLSDKTIPIDRFIFLYCDAGIGGQHTTLRILVDGQIIANRVLDFPIDFGPEYWKWKHATLMADKNGKNNAAMTVAIWGSGHSTTSVARIKRLQHTFEKYLADVGSPLAPRGTN